MDLHVEAPNPVKLAVFDAPFLIASDLSGARSLVSQVVAEAKAHRAHVMLLQVLYGAYGAQGACGDAGRGASLGPEFSARKFSTEEPAFSLTEIKRLRDARVALLGVAHEIEALGVPCTSAVRRGEVDPLLEEEGSRSHRVHGPVPAPGTNPSGDGAAVGIPYAHTSAVLIYLQGEPGKAA